MGSVLESWDDAESADDFVATGSDFAGRGGVQDALLAEMRAVWAGESRGTAGAIGPAPVQPGGPPLLIGGLGAAAIRRTTAFGAGWISGGGGPAMFADAAGRVRAAWTAAGREGAPRLVSLGYYALGSDGPDAARRYLSDYYAFAGPYADLLSMLPCLVLLVLLYGVGRGRWLAGGSKS